MHILVVDDHRLFRDGLMLVLKRLDDDVVISEAGDGEQAMQLLESQEFDLGLVDFHLPDTTGPQLLNRIKSFCPEMPVVIMSGAQDPAMIRSALSACASGFMPKSMEPEEILDAIKLVLAGGIYVPSIILEKLSNDQLDVSSANGMDYGDLIHLAQVTQKVIETSDWSLRAQNHLAKSPETVNAFNKMLEKMENKYNELREYAFKDPLTGLPNRRLFNDRLEQALYRVEREKKSLALVVLDLDGFKQINDTLGHDNGDKLLVTIGERLRSSTREIDTVCRLGGDEFIVLVGDAESEQDVLVAVDRIFTALTLPTELAGKQVTPGVSMGVSMTKGDLSQEELFRTADEALYKVKHAGKNGYQLYRAPQ